MPTTGDLINLNTLVLTDTFNTWLNRTNQIIDSVNPIQVYDVDVGTGTTAASTGGGLAKYTGQSAGNYNGVVTVGVNAGPGLAVVSLSGESKTIVDFRYFDDYGRTLGGTGGTTSPARVASSDEYIVNDVSEAGEGIAKKVQARYMLPPQVDVNALTISGDVIVLGNFTTYGNNNVIRGNNLQIEDKQIELAYQQAVALGLTGVTSGTFARNGGQTGYYFTTVSGLTPAFYGHIQSFTGAAAGPTGLAYFGSLFQDPYLATDVGATGYLSLSSTGSPRYLFNINYGVTSSFLDNITLDEAGIILKSSQGDKSFIWIWTDNDTGKYYDSWQSSSNIGVNGETNGVISRVYRSYGYTGVSQSQFIFTAESNKNAEIYLAETSNEVAPLTFTGGSWKIAKQSSNNYLVFSTGATGISSFSQSFVITPGASGATFAGVNVNNFASGLNVDQLDGAHASTVAAPYTIPVADSTGRVDGEFFNADAVRRRYTQAGHGLTFGQAVRIATSGGFTSAYATNPEYAEAIGIVSAVHSSSEFTVTHKGRIENISGSSMTVEGSSFSTGNVYFLAATGNRGQLIADPDYAAATRIVSGQIRKPMLLALSATQGYVVNYVGTKVPTATDQVYLYGLVPVGSIYPYAGSLTTLSSEWLLCDGDVYRALDYPELYNTIGTTYYGQIALAAGTVTSGTVVGGTRNIQAGYKFNITVAATTTEITVSSVNATTGVISFTTTPVVVSSSGNYKIVPTKNNIDEYLFFVPDLRTRTLVGSSTGSSDYTSVGLTSYTAGQFDGNELLTISTQNLPSHAHTLNTTYGALSSGATRFVTDTASGGTINSGSSGSGTPIDAHSPYLVTHYIIRAKANTEATILTGHNHDGRYHFLNDSMVVTGNGNYRGIPASSGADGFSVIAKNSLLGQTAYILNCAVPTTTVNAYDSKTRTWLMGDLSVWGTGLTSIDGATGTNRSVFSFRTHRASLVIEGGTASMPSPNIVFYTDGAGDQGSVQGLTSPQSDSWAANKYYSDSSNKIIKTSGAYRGVPYTSGVTGFNIVADASILGFTAHVWSMFVNPNPTSGNSHAETYFSGDLTIWGDGLSSGSYTGHTDIVFAVDPLRSEVTIEGRNARVPTLTFLNDDTGSPAIGKIRGLTAPTENDQAANKWYVDNKFMANSYAEQTVWLEGGELNRNAYDSHLTDGRDKIYHIPFPDNVTQLYQYLYKIEISTPNENYDYVKNNYDSSDQSQSILGGDEDRICNALSTYVLSFAHFGIENNNTYISPIGTDDDQRPNPIWYYATNNPNTGIPTNNDRTTGYTYGNASSYGAANKKISLMQNTQAIHVSFGKKKKAGEGTRWVILALGLTGTGDGNNLNKVYTEWNSNHPIPTGFYASLAWSSEDTTVDNDTISKWITFKYYFDRNLTTPRRAIGGGYYSTYANLQYDNRIAQSVSLTM